MSPLVSSIATIIAASCALRALYIWKKEHIWKRSEVYKHEFLLSISQYTNAVLLNSHMSLNFCIEKLNGNKEHDAELFAESLENHKKNMDVQLDNLYATSGKIYFIANNNDINNDILNLNVKAMGMLHELGLKLFLNAETKTYSKEDIVEIEEIGKELINEFLLYSKNIRDKLDSEIKI
ncbi:hypothetical protein [Pseudocolwellia agarivorans]|uniref:hypothetical protein n=1 Tax=Pseudocolwellia agarivorans TaxID=1911682 RepID=UPI003F883750